jgi:hypothetical protein
MGRSRITYFRNDKDKGIPTKVVFLCVSVSLVAIVVGCWRNFWPPPPALASICSLPSQNKTLGYVIANVTILNPPSTPQNGKYVFVRHGRIQAIFDELELPSFQQRNPNVTVLTQYPLPEPKSGFISCIDASFRIFWISFISIIAFSYLAISTPMPTPLVILDQIICPFLRS